MVRRSSPASAGGCNRPVEVIGGFLEESRFGETSEVGGILRGSGYWM